MLCLTLIFPRVHAQHADAACRACLITEDLPEAPINEVAGVAHNGCMQALEGRPQAAALLVVGSEEKAEAGVTDQARHFRDGA